MFQYTEFEEGNSGIALPGEEANLSIKEKIKTILHSKPIHIIIIVLIVLDIIFVLLEMLIDVDLLDVEEPVPELLHGISIAILSTFMVEIGLKIYVNPKHFFTHKIEILDAVVVLISWVVDIVLAVIEESEVLAFLGLLVLLRLIRITNGVVVTAKAKADERVQKIKNKYKTLEDQFEEAENKIQSRDEEISSLIKLLREHGVEYKVESKLDNNSTEA